MDYQEKLPSVVTPGELEVPGIRVVDDEGKEIVRPDVIQAVTQLAQLAQLSRIRKSLEKEHVEGKQYSDTLEATDSPRVVDLIREIPYTPLATAYFFNDGPDTAHIGINRRGGYVTIKKGENHSVDNTKADRRIELIYYWCDPGDTASVRVAGKY